MADFVLDDLCLKILSELQPAGRATSASIAAKLGVVPSTVSKKITAMEQANVISQFRCIIDTGPDARHNRLTCFEYVLIKLKSHEPARAAEFEQRLRQFNVITEIHKVQGEGRDYLVKVACRLPRDFRKFLTDLAALPNFDKTDTITVIETLLDREPSIEIALGNGDHNAGG